MGQLENMRTTCEEIHLKSTVAEPVSRKEPATQQRCLRTILVGRSC